MKERPILFSGEMVCATLDDLKILTRRVIKPQPGVSTIAMDHVGGGEFVPVLRVASRPHGVHGPRGKRCPYGVPGDHLWVRETWATLPEHDHLPPRDLPHDVPLFYAAEYPNLQHGRLATACGRWRPSIFMPRWASRIDMEATGVRVERVQEISEEDAKAEGCRPSPVVYAPEFSPGQPCVNRLAIGGGSMVETFADLWNRINAERGYSWESNPWVWVVEFRRIEP